MASKRSNTIFIVINIIVSLAVALGVIGVYTSTQTTEEPRARPTIVLVVSATPDPNQPLPPQALQATIDAQSGTLVALERTLLEANAQVTNLQNATPIPAEGNNTLPQPTTSRSDTSLPTIDPKLIPILPTNPSSGAGGAEGEATLLPTSEDGCQRYFVQAGDTASTIATRFEISMGELFVLNGINDRTILQIGDELLIPSESCEEEIPPTITPTPQPTFNLTIVAPTATLVPVAADAQIKIVQVLNTGDITAEQVELQNVGGEINLRGWTLSDGQTNVFTFPDVRLVSGSVIRVSSRVGTNTPGFLYWNQTSPIWSDGETATLTDSEGEIQSILIVGSEVIEFGATPTP